MRNLIVLGSQWGDEGKGKIVDLLSARFDVVARYQGGHNAGHTIIIGDRKFVLKLIPSGILHPGKRVVIGNGLVIDPVALFSEIESLENAGIDVAAQLRISDRAHVLFPAHQLMEKRIHIGTTSRGIGPCYEDKAGRRGVRIADLLDLESFPALFAELMEEKTTVAKAFGIDAPAKPEAVREQYQALAERLRPMVCDTAEFLNAAIGQGQSVLFEGAQGTMLDLDHGTYPYVTSSSATAGGACTGTGVSPTRINGIIGIAKAYLTRVGGGPFPTETLDAQGDAIRERGNEFGSVTGRPRRCGWFDVPMLRYTAMINGFDTLVLTKLDVLDELDQIPVCTGYRGCEGMPSTVRDLERAEPVFEFLPGWRSSTEGIARYENLPAKAQEYVSYIERKTGVEVGCISTGPERNQTIVRAGSRFAQLTH